MSGIKFNLPYHLLVWRGEHYTDLAGRLLEERALRIGSEIEPVFLAANCYGGKKNEFFLIVQEGVVWLVHNWTPFPVENSVTVECGFSLSKLEFIQPTEVV